MIQRTGHPDKIPGAHAILAASIYKKLHKLLIRKRGREANRPVAPPPKMTSIAFFDGGSPQEFTIVVRSTLILFVCYAIVMKAHPVLGKPDTPLFCDVPQHRSLPRSLFLSFVPIETH